MERSEYEPVSLPLGRGSLSILFWLALFVYAASYDWSRPLGTLVWLSTGWLLTGCWLAWSGWRHDKQSPAVARTGLLLNVGGLVCVVLPVMVHYSVLWLGG